MSTEIEELAVALTFYDAQLANLRAQLGRNPAATWLIPQIAYARGRRHIYAHRLADAQTRKNRDD